MENKRMIKLKNSRGVTLIELLAGIVILGFVLILSGHLLTAVQKQYSIQNEQIEQQKNLRLASQYITKDIRKENLVSIPEKNVLVIGKNRNQIRYELKDTTLKRNGVTLIPNISKLTIVGLTQNDHELVTGQFPEIVGIKLVITTTANQMGATETLSSTVYLRRE